MERSASAGALRIHSKRGGFVMAWSRPKLREICIGMEINGYFAGKI
jgi:coenzyme PQQ precursor peptide PqqA